MYDRARALLESLRPRVKSSAETTALLVSCLAGTSDALDRSSLVARLVTQHGATAKAAKAAFDAAALLAGTQTHRREQRIVLVPRCEPYHASLWGYGHATIAEHTNRQVQTVRKMISRGDFDPGDFAAVCRMVASLSGDSE